MHSSEKKTFIIAIIIVILGTLVIATGFTLGLIFLTEPDVRLHTESSVSFDVVSVSSDLSSDIQIDSTDLVIPVDIASIDESFIGMDLDEYFKKDKEEDLIHLDVTEQADQVDRSIKDLRTIGLSAGNRWIIIDKSKFSLTLNNRKGVLREWGIAVGSGTGNKQHKGDNRTPIGTFRISHIQDSSKWTHDFRDGKGEITGAYGPWFIRLFTPPWTGIGIHGTHDPDSIGARASEGCIRMNNEDVSELKKLVKVGMAVIIVE